VKPGGQREKGKSFERKIARILRQRWPGALVRRASQAERAHNPDVFVEGAPRILQRLWLELQDAANPTPSAKLAQARRDVDADPRQHAIGEHRIPVAITHKLGAQSISATIGVMDLFTILATIGRAGHGEVTLPLDHLLDLVTESEAT
jgi:hypothetical protein